MGPTGMERTRPGKKNWAGNPPERPASLPVLCNDEGHVLFANQSLPAKKT